MATRRRLLLTIGSAAAVAPASVHGQPSPRSQRLGWVRWSSRPSMNWRSTRDRADAGIDIPKSMQVRADRVIG
jgi:hypothetical protein